jgi:hypothetical protein
MKQTQVILPSNRKFGFFFAFVFILLSAYLFWSDLELASFLCTIFTILLLTISLINPTLLAPFNKLWLQLGLGLAWLVNPLIMGTIFFGIFTPVSLLTKLAGRDILNLRMKQLESYWTKQTSKTNVQDPFKNQF